MKKCILNVGVEYETYLVHNINDVRGFTWRFGSFSHLNIQLAIEYIFSPVISPGNKYILTKTSFHTKRGWHTSKPLAWLKRLPRINWKHLIFYQNLTFSLPQHPYIIFDAKSWEKMYMCLKGMRFNFEMLYYFIFKNSLASYCLY